MQLCVVCACLGSLNSKELQTRQSSEREREREREVRCKPPQHCVVRCSILLKLLPDILLLPVACGEHSREEGLEIWSGHFQIVYHLPHVHICYQCGNCGKRALV